MQMKQKFNAHSLYIALGLVLFLLIPCMFCFSQNVAELERNAQALYLEGEGKMKTSDYEDAIGIFRDVLKRFPDTETRYEAQFRIADAYIGLRNETEAITILNSIVKEGSDKWAPKALIKTGEIYASSQRYSESFRAYRLIITDYSNSPEVDMAHFAVGKTHFQLGHYELAADSLQMVGLAISTHSFDSNRVTPGQPLYMRVQEPNMVAQENTELEVTVTTSAGDVEKIQLVPEAIGGSQFGITIFTEMGNPKPNDGILQMSGTDTITMTYLSQYLGGRGVLKTIKATAASTGIILIRDISGDEMSSVLVPDSFILEIDDPDRDLTGAADKITVDLTTRLGDKETITLTETGVHTGIFRATITTAIGAPIPNSGKLETNAEMLENSTTQYNDYITVTYLDPLTMVSEEGLDTSITQRVFLFKATDAIVFPPDYKPPVDTTMLIRTTLYKGKSLLQIAVTYADLGQPHLGNQNFLEARDQFNNIINTYPNAPEVEEAMYGLFDILVAQEQYDAAISQLSRITDKFPNSNQAGEAMLALAELHIKREEYDRALGIYQSIVQRTRGTALAEAAQFAICETYIAMYKPIKTSFGVSNMISPSQIYGALEEFITSYPNSDKTPDALYRLTQMRYNNGDYQGAINNARRMFSNYPDHVLTGRTLLMQAEAYAKLNKNAEAVEVLRNIIANYGSEAPAAERLLTTVSRRL